MVFIGVSSCKKVCYECTDVTGEVIAQKCFKDKGDMQAYEYTQVNKPQEQRCQ